MAKLSATNARQQVFAIKALPQTYYDTSIRLVRVCRLMDRIDGNDRALLARARAKRDALTAELQAIVDGVLGPAECPICTGEGLARAALRRRAAVRTCVAHDLEVLLLRHALAAPPGTDERE